MRSSSGLGILLKSLKRPMMVLRLAISMPSVAVLSRKTSSNSASGKFARAHQVLDRELQRKERILELVGKPSRQFAPCGHALALHQPLALARELFRHVIEAARQHAHFVVSAFRHARIPVAARHLFGGVRQLLDRPRDARRDPQAEDDGQQNSACRDAIGDGADMLLRLDHAAARERATMSTASTLPVSFFQRNRGGVDAVFAPVCQIEEWRLLAGRSAARIQSAAGSERRRGRRRWRRSSAWDRRPRRSSHWADWFASELDSAFVVEAHLHSRRDRQIGEEALVERLPPTRRNGGLRAAESARTANSPRALAAIGQLFALQECGFARGGCSGFRIAEARRPLRRADDVAIGPHDLEKVELRILRHGLRFGQIRRGIAGLHESRKAMARARSLAARRSTAAATSAERCWNSR